MPVVVSGQVNSNGTIEANPKLERALALGRFISPDPVMDVSDPQQMHGYAYANSNPVSFTDPDGLFLRKTWNRVRRATSRVRNRARTSVRRVWNAPRVRNLRSTVRRTVVHRARRTHSFVNRAVRRVPQRSRNFAGGVGSALTWSPARALTDYAVRKTGVGRTWDQHMASVGINSNSTAFKAGETTVDIAVEVVTGPIPAGTAMRALRNGDKLADLFKKLRRGGSSGCNSFVPGTLVLMADGTSKSIEEIRAGEQVLATDPETGEEGPREVLATIIGSGAKTLVEITVDTSTQIEASALEQGKLAEVSGLPGPTVLGDVIVATDEHPFWSPESETWVDAIDLLPGMWLLSSEGTLVQVSGVQTWTQTATVHNLTVQGIHTYYVLVEQESILVHNSNSSCGLREGYTSSPAFKDDPYHPDKVAERSKESHNAYGPTVADQARDLGYPRRIPANKTPFDSHGQPAFFDGKNYITRDVDGHNVSNGWKMFDRRGDRVGTYDADLNYIKH